MKKTTGVHLSYAANLSKVWGPPLTHTGESPEVLCFEPPMPVGGEHRQLRFLRRDAA
jgi:hypothetical protein